MNGDPNPTLNDGIVIRLKKNYNFVYQWETYGQEIIKFIIKKERKLSRKLNDNVNAMKKDKYKKRKKKNYWQFVRTL